MKLSKGNSYDLNKKKEANGCLIYLIGYCSDCSVYYSCVSLCVMCIISTLAYTVFS